VSQPAWQRSVLARGDLYRVGGAVRDALLGLEPRESDFLVRGLPPEELVAILERHGKLSRVGKSFGVYKFTPTGAKTVDIVYPRRERSTGPGHRDFDVQWDWRLSVEDDLRRRDFTINAIARNARDDTLIDPLGGQGDLKARILRMIFPEAFREDALRILRGVRFAARFALTADPDTRSAMAAASSLLDTLSAERVQEELTRLLTETQTVSGALVELRELGALRVILPELDRCAGVEQNAFHPDDVFVHSLKSCDAAPSDDLLVRWAALMHDVGKVDARREVEDAHGARVVFYGHEVAGAEHTRAALERLRYPHAFVARCEKLVALHMFGYTPEWKGATVRRFMRRVGEDLLEPLFRLREADCRSRGLRAELDALDELRGRVAAERAAQRAVTVADLALDGGDVMRACAIPPGPLVGKILEGLLEAVIEDPSLNDAHELERMARAMVASEREGEA